ncbi:MAG: O-antigen ligase family protein [Opitutaceae bacterium]|nr:O-antigen ligase family protein [Opitutaceae bacterium]
MPQPHSPNPAPPRWHALGEWVLVLGLAGTLAGTTLGLGGALPQTRQPIAWALGGLTALGGVLWLAGRGRGGPAGNLAALLPLPFLCYALASVLWLAPARWLAWREWWLWLEMWLVFVLALHFGRERRHLWVFVLTFIALGLAGAGMAAYQRFVDPEWLMLGRQQATQFFGRSSGMFGVPNSLAGLYELMIPACLALLFSRATGLVAKLACAWLAAVFLFAVVLTGSRGGWIGLGLALALWPVLAARAWWKGLAGAAAILAAAAAGLAVLYQCSDHARNRIQPFLDGQFEASRPVIWKVGVRIWQEHPWLGSGSASYNVRFDQYRPRGFRHVPVWTHNDYLNTLSDYGVAGFVLWGGAGAGMFLLGWRAVRRARREKAGGDDPFALARWKLGLLVGLLAWALHLAVDFHTKIPALAFAAAVAMALLLRDEPALRRDVRPAAARTWGVLAVGLGLGLPLWSGPSYRAESLRFEARRALDRQALGQDTLAKTVPPAIADLREALALDPANGRAWADLAFALAQAWHLERGDLARAGRDSEQAARRALALCPWLAEAWIRLGVALDMQGRLAEGEPCFERALQLAPHSSSWWYYYAYHLQSFPQRRDEARRAVETCLALDPSNPAGEALRKQLVNRH